MNYNSLIVKPYFFLLQFTMVLSLIGVDLVGVNCNIPRVSNLDFGIKLSGPMSIYNFMNCLITFFYKKYELFY